MVKIDSALDDVPVGRSRAFHRAAPCSSAPRRIQLPLPFPEERGLVSSLIGYRLVLASLRGRQQQNKTKALSIDREDATRSMATLFASSCQSGLATRASRGQRVGKGAVRFQRAQRAALNVRAAAMAEAPEAAEAQNKAFQRPDPTGRYGRFGGRYVPETLIVALDELEAEYAKARQDPAFQVRGEKGRGAGRKRMASASACRRARDAPRHEGLSQPRDSPRRRSTRRAGRRLSRPPPQAGSWQRGNVAIARAGGIGHPGGQWWMADGDQAASQAAAPPPAVTTPHPSQIRSPSPPPTTTHHQQ